MIQRSNLLIAAIVCIAAIAAGLSGYLTWTTWSSSSVAGCTGDSLVDCDEVLSSPWSRWLGLPVSLFGLLTYVAILSCCALLATPMASLGTTGLLALSITAASAAVWFIGLQAVIVQSFCMYCLAVHACGLTIGMLVLLVVRDSANTTDYDQMRVLLGVAGEPAPTEAIPAGLAVAQASPLVAMAVAAGGMVALIGGQLLLAPETMVLDQTVELVPLEDVEPEQEEVAGDVAESSADALSDATQSEGTLGEDADWLDAPSGASRRLRYKGLRQPVALANSILIGPATADQVIIEMMDYTCKHCRKLHPHLMSSLDRYGGQLAYVIHHTPLDRECNKYIKKRSDLHRKSCEYARLAIGVWQTAPERFLEFHDWLLEGEKPPPIATAKMKAIRLAGSKILTDTAARAEANRQLAQHCRTMYDLQTGLPQLLTSRGVLRGHPKSEDQLFSFLEKDLDLKPPVE